MVKTTAPATAIAASGTLADLLTFSTSRGRRSLRRSPRPAQPHTAKQTGARTIIKWTTAAWATLNTTQRATWAELAALDNITPYNSFTRLNAHRWTDDNAPQLTTALQPTDPYAATTTLAGANLPRGFVLTCQTTSTPETRLVTPGSPAPNPDCTGTYEYFANIELIHTYRRIPDHAYYLYPGPIYPFWFCGSVYPDPNAPTAWRRIGTQNGQYAAYHGATGNAIVSVAIPPITGTPPAAIALYRSPTPISTIDRNQAIAIVTCTPEGLAQHTDSPISPGTYHYRAVPLSLDGRFGTPTADVELTLPPE